MDKRESFFKVKALLTSIKRKVDVVSANKGDIYIFGAGFTAKLYKKCFEVEKIFPAGFLDNDVKKQGTTPFLTWGGSF